MATASFREPGTDATQDLTFFPFTSLTNGTIATATDQARTGPRALKSIVTSTNGTARAHTPDAVVSDTGARISVAIRLSSVAPSADTGLVVAGGNANGTGVLGFGVTTGGKLFVKGRGATAKAGATSLSANTWYRVTLAYVVTTSTNWTAKIYLNGTLDATTTNADGTLTATTTGLVQFGVNGGSSVFGSVGSILTCWYDDLFVDNGTGLDDPFTTDANAGKVTAKRPVANGTTNGFTTQIGAGGSGYGTGHAPQVNEQPLSQTNGWSMIGAGSAITEEYTAETAAVGDVDLTGATLVDVAGWVFAKSALAETGKIVVDGTQTNIALTSTATLFPQDSATPTAYPAGTGTDIGIITATTVTTVSLYEAGILVAYNQAVASGGGPLTGGLVYSALVGGRVVA